MFRAGGAPGRQGSKAVGGGVKGEHSKRVLVESDGEVTTTPRYDGYGGLVLVM